MIHDYMNQLLKIKQPRIEYNWCIFIYPISDQITTTTIDPDDDKNSSASTHIDSNDNGKENTK